MGHAPIFTQVWALAGMTEYLAASDIAELLSVSRPVVSNWQRRMADFPKPAITASHGKVKLWHKADIVTWYRARYAPILAALENI